MYRCNVQHFTFGNIPGSGKGWTLDVCALSLMPMSRKRLGEVVGTYRLNEFVADLTAAGIVCMNQSSGCLELATEVMAID